MNGYDGHTYSVAPLATTGEDKSASPAELQKGRETPASTGDLTPTPSRTPSPIRVSKLALKNPASSANGACLVALTNGIDLTDTGVDRSEVIDPLHAHSPRSTEHGPLGNSTVYDSHIPSKASSLFPSRSLTPKDRSAPDGIRRKDMSGSVPHPSPSSGTPHSIPTRRQQQQQQQQQQHLQRGFQPYGYPPATESGITRNPPSIPNQGGHASFAHAQQPTAAQRQASFAGQYTMSPPPSSLYSQHQVQHQYAYPQLNIPGMPPLAHAHSHASPEYYPVGHSTSPTQPSLYGSSFHTSLPQEHASTPTLTFDYDRTGNGGRSPASGSSSPYTPQPPFASFSFHPTVTNTPQFTHPHSPYSSPFPAQQGQHAQRPHYPPSYAYMTRASPSSSEDVSQSQRPPSTTWWFVPPHGPSPNTGPYPGMYYFDAYAHPSNPGTGPGHSPGPPTLPPASSSRPMPPPPFSISDTAVGSVSTVAMEGPRYPTEALTESGHATFSPRPRPLSPGVLDESVSERGYQEQRQVQSKQATRRSHLPNPPVQRSEWVMWVGNVPSDATHDELWRFFTRPLTPGISSSADVHPVRLLQQPPHLPAGLLSPSGSSSTSDANPEDVSGVQSVFLIARSNCAFVNYVSEAHLAAAVLRFNGIPLRPGDPRCPRLVCRVRGKDEDLRAGVGAQRGTGVHTRWIREQREREKGNEKQEKLVSQKVGAFADAEISTSEPPGTPLSIAVTESGTESSTQGSARRAPQHSSSSGSTTSGFLAQYFPKRYFILKSLTQYDLDLSVEKGVWATQPHNEVVLNQAFRNSSDVYLIFSVNKSGEFYGYARMGSPIGKAALDRVSWASRTDSQHSHSPAASFASSMAGRGSQLSETIPEEQERGSPESAGDSSKGKDHETDKGSRPLMLFSPSEKRLAEDSPQPVTPATQKRLSTAQEADSDRVPLSEEANSAPLPSSRSRGPLPQSSGILPVVRPPSPTSAPAVMGASHRRIASSLGEGFASETLDPRLLRHHLPEVQLNPEAPYRAIREEMRSSVEEDEDHSKRNYASGSGVGSRSGEAGRAEPPLSPRAGANPQPERGDHLAQWGSPFKIQWIRTQRLPFSRTRQFRNPWNHEREVKVSRDGTELEPSVGQALLDEWDKDEPSSPPPTTSAGSATPNRRGPHYRRSPSQVQTTSMPESETCPGTGSTQPCQQKRRSR